MTAARAAGAATASTLPRRPHEQSLQPAPPAQSTARGATALPPHLHGHHLAALQADVAAIKQAVERLTTAIAPK